MYKIAKLFPQLFPESSLINRAMEGGLDHSTVIAMCVTYAHVDNTRHNMYMWQSQVENEH